MTKSRKHAGKNGSSHQKSTVGHHGSRCHPTSGHVKLILLISLIVVMISIGSYLVADSVVSIVDASSLDSTTASASSVWTDDDDTTDNTGGYYDSEAGADGTPTAAPVKVKDPYASVEYGTADGAYGGYSGGGNDEMIVQRDEEVWLNIPTAIPTPQPTSASNNGGVIYQTVFHDETSAKYVAELSTQLEAPTLYPTMRPTETSAPTVLITPAPTQTPTESDAYDSGGGEDQQINGTWSPTSAPTALQLTLGSTDRITQLDLNTERVDAFVAQTVTASEGGAVRVAAEGFGRLYQTSTSSLRFLVPEFRDKSFVLSTGEVNEAAEEVLSDADFFSLVRTKLYQWSNRSYTVNKNGNVGVQRIGVPYKYKKRPSCTKIRKKLLKLAAKRDDSFTDDDARFAYYAAFCYQGSVSSSYIELSSNSLPMLFQQMGRKLQWTGSCASLVRTQTNKWSYLASVGDLLSASGGSVSSPGVTHWGPEGYLPMQKQAFGWLSPENYQQIVPTTQTMTYTLRTVREGTLANSSYPSALVWKDLVYGSDVWFSFYESSFVFDESYEEEMGDLAHGDGLGFAVHIPAEKGMGSVRTRLFGQSYQHPSGLLFKTLAYDRDVVNVTVTYRPNKQVSVVPYVKLTSRKSQSGTSSRYAQTQLSVVLDRDSSNIDQTTTDPFVISNLLRVECPWGNFTNGADENDLVLVGPSRITAGSDESGIDLEQYDTNLETFTPTITVSFESKGALTSTEKNTAYPCTLHIGQFLQKDLGLYFI